MTVNGIGQPSDLVKPRFEFIQVSHGYAPLSGVRFQRLCSSFLTPET